MVLENSRRSSQSSPAFSVLGRIGKGYTDFIMRLTCLQTGIVALCILLGGCSAPRGPALPDAVALASIDGATHQPLNSGAGATVVVFITNDCPIANAYAPEINRIVGEYSPRGVAFYLVHVDRGLAPSEAQTHAKEYGYTCPVLLDPEHELVKAIGATVTPEAAIIDQERRLAYRGRIDDRYTDFGKRRAEPSERTLRTALDSVLAGQPVRQPRTRSIGCYIDSDAAARSSSGQ